MEGGNRSSGGEKVKVEGGKAWQREEVEREEVEREPRKGRSEEEWGNVEKGWEGKGGGTKARGKDGRRGVRSDYGGSGGMNGVDGKDVNCRVEGWVEERVYGGNGGGVEAE